MNILNLVIVESTQKFHGVDGPSSWILIIKYFFLLIMSSFFEIEADLFDDHVNLLLREALIPVAPSVGQRKFESGVRV